MHELLTFLAIMCLVTVCVESVPALFQKDKLAWWKASIVCNVVTNPVLNVLVALLTSVLDGNMNWITPVFILLEGIVVFLEAWFYQKMLGKDYSKCLIFSGIANMLSYCAGIAINWLFVLSY